MDDKSCLLCQVKYCKRVLNRRIRNTSNVGSWCVIRFIFVLLSQICKLKKKKIKWIKFHFKCNWFYRTYVHFYNLPVYCVVVRCWCWRRWRWWCCWCSCYNKWALIFILVFSRYFRSPTHMKFQLLDCCEFPRPNICLSCAIANIFDYHFVHTIIACVWWGASVWYRCGWGIEGELR